MPKLTVALLADSIVRDADTNTLSVFNLMEEVNAVGFPTVLARCSSLWIFTRTKDEAERFDAVLELILDEIKLGEFPGLAVDFQGQDRTRTILTLQMLVLPKPGTLTWKLRIGADQVETIVVPVKNIGPMVQAPPVPKSIGPTVVRASTG